MTAGKRGFEGLPAEVQKASKLWTELYQTRKGRGVFSVYTGLTDGYTYFSPESGSRKEYI